MQLRVRMAGATARTQSRRLAAAKERGSSMDEIKKLAEMLRQSKDTLVLTGAGISTESGIPDFRSPGTGLWTRMDPMELLSRPALERDPVGFWRRVEPMFRQMAEARPNEGHYALARLEKAGLIRGVVTQNIDSLHQKAGANVVLEVHGHLRSVRPGAGQRKTCRHF